MVDCMSISNGVPLGAINHSQLVRGIVHKYRMEYRWGIRKYVGVLGPKERRATTARVATTSTARPSWRIETRAIWLPSADSQS